MARHRKSTVPFKKVKKAAEAERNAALKVSQMKAKFQAVHEQKKSLTPDAIHTHARQRTYPISSITELINRPVPWAASTNDEENVYLFCDYCIQALKILQISIETLTTAVIKYRKEIEKKKKAKESGERVDDDSSTSATTAATKLALGEMLLFDNELDALQKLRGSWMEHLKTHLYDLWAPPPSSGGATARYSLAVQLWLLVTHVNVLLQRSNATDALFDFNPSLSIYLVRNSLVVDTSPVMNYSMRTLVMAFDKFILELDTIDRFHPDYITYAVALEHRVSELIADVGSPKEFDALEWCVTHGARAVEEAKKAEKDNFIEKQRKRKEKSGGSSTQRHALTDDEEQCSDEFIMASMIWMLTIYHYAECWFKLNSRIMPDGRVQHTRVPAHVVARSDWVPSSRSIRALSCLMLRYTKGLKESVYTVMLRLFLLQFELRPSDMDMVRLFNKHNYVHCRSVLEYEFKGRSQVARAYLRKVHYDRPMHEYMVEAFQWAHGDEQTTTSASLMREGFFRELAVLFAINQLISARFHFEWKERFLMIHRDIGFVTRFETARTLGWPFVVQQFSRFSVFVPHRRDPRLDYADVLRWRARSRQLMAQYNNSVRPVDEGELNDLNDAMNRLQMMGDEYNNANQLRAGDEADADPAYGGQPGGAVPPDSEAGVLRDYQTQQFNRVYDCKDALTAFAVWGLWFLQICNGVVDADINMRQFLLDALEWVKPE